MIKQGWLRALIFFPTFWALSIFGGYIVLAFLELFSLTGLVDLTPLYYQFERVYQESGLYGFALAFILYDFIASIAFFVLFKVLIDRENILSSGLRIRGHLLQFLAGNGVAAVILVPFFLALLAAGWIRVTGFGMSLVDLLFTLLLYVIVALKEEIIFRGYIQHNLQKSMNRFIAIGITTMLFMLMHMMNPNASVIGMIGILIAGVQLGIAYSYTGNLWFAIGMHFAWNFILGPILGSPVSGLTTASLIHIEITGPEAITGGEFGFEGSWIIHAACLISSVLIFFYYRKKSAVSVETAVIKVDPVEAAE